MASFYLLFTFILFPFLLGVLLIFGQFLYQKRKHNDNFSTLTNSLTLHPNFLHFFRLQDHIFRPKLSRKSMDERKELMPMRRKSSLLNFNMEEAQRQAQARKELDAQTSSSQPSSPMSSFKKSSSTRLSCLCSPTTHVGSFRCRLHRHGNTKPGFRRGHSVGADLSELASKLSSKPSSTSSSLQIK